MTSKKSLNARHSAATREAVLEMLRAAAKEGKTQADAARSVVAEFTDGPPLTTVLTWARRGDITFAKKTAEKAAASSADVTRSRDGSGRRSGKEATQKPTYSSEFRGRAVGEVVALMEREGLSLHAAALRLREQEPGMPSVVTLRNWVKAQAGAGSLQKSTVVETAAALASEPSTIAPDLQIDEDVDDLAGVEDMVNAARPEAVIVRTELDLFETRDLLVRFEQLVKENQKLREDNAKLAEVAENSAKLHREVVTLRATVRNYFDILEHDERN